MTKDEIIQLMGEEIARLRARKKILGCFDHLEPVDTEPVNATRCERCNDDITPQQ